MIYYNMHFLDRESPVGYHGINKKFIAIRAKLVCRGVSAWNIYRKNWERGNRQ